MLYFFHGLESGPHGAKYHLIREHYPELKSPDFQGMNLQQRLDAAAAITAGQSQLTLVGSSFGGLLAARLYALYPERIDNLLLLAPAVHTEEGDKVTRMPAAGQVRVLQGYDDDVVPYDKVAAFCQRFALPLTGVQDGHRLSSDSSQQAIIRLLREIHITN
ncbi:alpha/beta hydrolase [Aliidiomarina taiwanensis]|uniref:Alpha/beta hydrolase n=1 Tax=Aliidiomarina taiwanensis TaxID=946228 RepID=A0A432X7T9_9GAMM|nr:alpha/beta fold hydrolase [Aliidiomarina taiwanensis]RUO42923.1 alpha/beta hydrolase [Aliidiomarina taiwanensis]